MSEFLEVVLKAAGVLGIGVAAFLGLLKLAVPHFLEKELRRHQADLDRQLEDFKIRAQAQYEEKLERARHELNLQAHEHSVRFTRLHQKRATVIATTYEKLDKLHRKVRAMLQCISTDQDRPEGWKDALTAYNDLADYWYGRSIWLEEGTNDAIRPVVEALLEPIQLLALTRNRNFDDLRSAVHRANELTEQTVPRLRTTMERDLRRVLAAERESVRS